MTLQAILNCADASFDHYELNCETWMLVRTWCKDLLDPEELERYQALYEGNNDRNLQSEWETLLDKFYNSDEDVGSSDNGGQANLRDDIKIDSKTMREKNHSVSSAKSLFPVPQGQACSDSSLSRFLGEYIFFFA